MTKLIRFDEDHYGYLIDSASRMTSEKAMEFAEVFAQGYPGKRLVVLAADEFIDLTGQYEVLPIAEPVA